MKTALISLLAFTLCIFNSYSQAAGDFRSVASGNWNVVTTWERFDGTSWITPAPSTPVQGDGVVTIQSPHNVTFNVTLTIDQVVVNAGATLTSSATSIMTIGNSAMPAGSSELIINGTFVENSTTTIAFVGGGTWSMGANGTLIKTTAAGSNAWNGPSYEGGIASIPATSNWILRKTGGANPVLTTVGAFYGNLTLENFTGGTWVTAGGSTFTGAAGFPTIKGNLDIGGTGPGLINFINQHTNANPTLIIGNFIVRAGSNYLNFGTGTEHRGNLQINGTYNYDNNDARRTVFSGGNAQSISIAAGGVLLIWDMIMNKTVGTALTLNNTITVDNLSTFNTGIINSSAANLFQFWVNSTVTNANNNSFVNGPVRRFGNTGITFPIGKGAAYRPLILGSNAPIVPFWTENFGTAGCASKGTIVTAYAGVNGPWTMTISGVNGATPNQFYVSSTEAGMSTGACGDGCESNAALTNKTLHIGNVAGSPAGAFFCPGGDCGAAYDASGGCSSDRRAESPTVNCTGQVGINVSFNYIENGSGSGINDNAEMWYFDGAVWSFLVDMPKTATGCCVFGSCQGIWTPYNVALPASANNNPNVKIGFRWINNGDNAGSDPSFAVDDIQFYIPSTATFTAEYFPANPQVPYGNILVPSLSAISNCEYWILDRNAGTQARTVGLTWNAATCFNTQYTSFEVARWDNISGIWQDHNGVLSGPPGVASGIVTTPATVPSFSPFAIAYVPAPLPVEMESIHIDCEDGTGVLTWQTSSEINNDHFDIERSTDATNWEEMGRVSGNGNSNVSHSYSWVDHNPLSEGYYRIKQVDFDGLYKTYDPVYLHCISQNNWIHVYPNPSSGTVNIDISQGTRLDAVMVYNSLGQFTTNATINGIEGKATVPVDISFLEPGTYYLRLLVNGEWLTRPVVIIK
jgi:hypothetical protein